MKRTLQIFGGALLAIVILLLIGIGFAQSGAYNVAATHPHARPVAQILRMMTVRSVSAHARGLMPPADFNPKDHALIERGADHYEMMCRTCHGAPGSKPEAWQLYPPPPDLADALRVTGWTDAEVFWIIKNGIKDTAMSAFGSSHDDDDLWALTAFVRQLATITPDQYRTMAAHAHANGSEEGMDHAHPHQH